MAVFSSFQFLLFLLFRYDGHGRYKKSRPQGSSVPYAVSVGIHIITGKAYPVHVPSCLLKDQITEDAEKYGSGNKQAGYLIQKPEESPEADNGYRCPYGGYSP